MLELPYIFVVNLLYQLNEKQFLDEITKKYGEGSLNPENGEFTPNK